MRTCAPSFQLPSLAFRALPWTTWLTFISPPCVKLTRRCWTARARSRSTGAHAHRCSRGRGASVTTHIGAQWRSSRALCAAHPTLSNILRSSGRRFLGLPLPVVQPDSRCSPRLCSLRTLCRAMEYARAAMQIYGLQRALLDGLSMVRFGVMLQPRGPSFPLGFKIKPETSVWAYRNLA